MKGARREEWEEDPHTQHRSETFPHHGDSLSHNRLLEAPVSPRAGPTLVPSALSPWHRCSGGSTSVRQLGSAAGDLVPGVALPGVHCSDCPFVTAKYLVGTPLKMILFLITQGTLLSALW